MENKKKMFADGLNGLIQTPDQATTTSTTTPASAEPAAVPPAARKRGRPKTRGEYTTVSYNIESELAERIRYCAYLERRKMNEVITDAFKMYLDFKRVNDNDTTLTYEEFKKNK